MAGLRQCMRLSQTAMRKISTNRPAKSAITPEESGLFKNLRTHQEQFQKEDTIEDVYIKGGVKDTALFKIICAATVAGVIFDINLFYSLATTT